MKTVIIVAMTPDGLIGREGRLPWHEPADLAHFKRTTTGHAVIMGRRTFESIARPLPNRRNMVLTRGAAAAARLRQQFGQPASQGGTVAAGASNAAASAASLDVVESLEAAIELCRRRGEQFAYVVGGAQIYAAALPLVDEMIVTWIHRPDLTGDTYFPPWDRSTWRATPVANDAGLDIVRYVR